MKKRILFVITYLNTGGICRSLQNFLNLYDATAYEVDVFAMVHQGAFKNQFSNCNLLPSNFFIEASVAHLDNQHGMAKATSAILKIADKITNYAVQRSFFRYVGRKLLNNNHYNAVIGFSEGLPSLFVSMMKHPNKIGWIHCDYASYMKVGSGLSEERIYEKLKSVVCVSDYTRESFIGVYPSMQDKTFSIYNIIDDKMIIENSQKDVGVPFDKNYFNIVSIGRIDPVKRLSKVPELARKVLNAGCKIRWYIIGPMGGTPTEYNLTNDNIHKYHVEGTVILLGEKTNPYPFIKQADLLVNTSISEACPYVINEAKILGTPVVCTNFGSAKEFINDGDNGKYGDIHILDQIIVSLVNDEDLLMRIKSKLETFTYNNNYILQKIYSLL